MAFINAAGVCVQNVGTMCGSIVPYYLSYMYPDFTS